MLNSLTKNNKREMMEQMLLDRSSLLDIPENYHGIDSEVEFLNLALSGKKLFIQGATLCDWAIEFFRARQITYRELRSPKSELLSVFPALTEAQAEEILKQTLLKLDTIDPPLTQQKILNGLFPNEIWFENPSLSHSATWLLWLYNQNPKEFIISLLKQIASDWQEYAPDEIKVVYSATDKQSALSILEDWLGMRREPIYSFSAAFLLQVPKDIEKKAGDCYIQRIIETDGNDIELMRHHSLPSNLKSIYYKKCYDYFLKNHSRLTPDLLQIISPHLGLDENIKLRGILPPEKPSAFPQEPEKILEWVRNEYMPFRVWQMNADDSEAHKVSLDFAQQFINWYLIQYPKALSGNKMRRLLSFEMLNELIKEDNRYLSLVIVLDGLHLKDGDYLLNRLLEKCQRLTLIKSILAFSALPTITQFCKESLFHGVPPSQVNNVAPLGEILPEGKLPNKKLMDIKPGDACIWSINEPDHTYHSKKNQETLIHSVEAQLDAIEKNIEDIVAQVANEIPLKIIIATDHGRLFSKSLRKISIPAEMECHGRAAWRKESKIEYDDSGYKIEKDVVFLNPDLFCIPYENAICLGEDTFLLVDGKTGKDLFTHGGLFPEEVVVPMFVLCRDYEQPKIEINLSGRGVAGKSSRLKITVNNLSELEISGKQIKLIYQSRPEIKVNINFTVLPLKSNVFEIDYEPWPSSKDLKFLEAKIMFEQENGFKFEIQTAINLEVEEMYTGDQILEGLDDDI
jgi:hypothetical protein